MHSVQYQACWASSAKCFVMSRWMGPAGTSRPSRPKKVAPAISEAR